MAFNINEFIQNNVEGFAREAHFELLITLPSILKGDGKKLSLLCHSATLPSRSAETVEIARLGQGFRQPYVVGARFERLNVSVYCDARADNLKLLNSWADLLFDTHGKNLQQVQYRTNYSSDMDLIQYDTYGRKIANWHFSLAFPETIGSVPFSWAARNSMISIPVTFAYFYYTETVGAVSGVQDATPRQTPAPITGQLQNETTPVNNPGNIPPYVPGVPPKIT